MSRVILAGGLLPPHSEEKKKRAGMPVQREYIRDVSCDGINQWAIAFGMISVGGAKKAVRKRDGLARPSSSLDVSL